MSVHLKWAKISNGRIATGTGDLPKVCPLQIYSKVVMYMADAHGQVVHTFIGEEFLHAPTRLYRRPRSLFGRVGEHQVCRRLIVSCYFCLLRTKGRSTKASASALPSLTPLALLVSSQLPPSLCAKRLTKVLPSDTASRAVILSMPPLSPRIPLAHHLRDILPLLSLSRMSATSNTYTSHVAALHKTKDEVHDGGETNVDGEEVYFQGYTSSIDLARRCE